MRAHDWSATPLGLIEDWPQNLRTAVNIMLASPSPISIIWGPERIQLYNDAYIPIAAERHPEALGRPAAQNWSEAYETFLRPIFDRVFAGETVEIAEHAVQLHRRSGEVEERFFTGSFQPVRDESGDVEGIFHPLTEVTEKVRADVALRKRDERLRGVLDGMAEGFGLLAPDFTILEHNLEASRLDGRQREEVIGRTHWEAYPGSENSELGRVLKHAMANRQLVALEHRYNFQNGRTLWLEMRAYPAPEGALAVFWRDVTKRKEAEEALRASEAHLSAIFDQSAAGLSEVDPTGRFTRVNDRYCEIVGRPREELLGLRMHELTHPDDLVGNVPMFERAASGGDAFEIVKRYVRPDGSLVWVHNSVTALRDPEGRVANTVCVTIDITERKAAEERLREINETLEARVAARAAERDRLWNLSQDMLARADYSGMMSAVSPAWTQVLGWSEDELLTRGYASFMHPDDMPLTLEAIRRMAETRQPTRFENRIATSDGGWKPIEWTVAPEPDGLNFIAVGRDLSLTKAREAKLAAAQEALRQSQKMEAMGQLTGGVAHDFNNLLTPIVGTLDMLQRKGLGGDREQRLVAGAMQSAERAKTLVQRLLAFARRQPLQSVAVDVGQLVAGMGDLVSSTTGPQIRVVVEAQDDLPPAQADPNQLEMALLNLAVNARDAMPEGGTLRISANAEKVGPKHRSGLRPDTYISLSVADTGAGMDEATLARATEPFFSTKGIGKGTGLGLSMVHGLTSQLGGALTIQSRPGMGTNVELWLPRSTMVPEATAGAVELAEPPATRRTALLVDDEELVRMSTADMLGDLGYEVVEAASGEEALRLVSKGEKFDLLVTDHLMPGINGTDLARAVRSARPGVPILLVSGYAEREGVDPDLPRLTKPFRKDELASSLAQLTSGQ
ncbi:MAG TPA: PAS domain S-box protein [Microvirga sp.]|nr:PAS domain S-box protein [Microvirga sp.]